MKGLLLKEWYTAWRYFRAILLVDVLFFAVALFAHDNGFFLVYPCLMTGTLTMQTMAVEQQDGWERYAGTLPVTRGQLVSVKYIMTLLCLLVLLAATALVETGTMLRRGSFCWDTYSNLPILLGVSLLIPAIANVPMFRFGFAKGRIVYFVVLSLLGAIAGMLSAMSILTNGLGMNMISLPVEAGVALIGIAGYGFSWWLSIKCYQKREL